MADEVTLTIPSRRDFHRVAHLVVGGLAVRLNLTIETLEDLQIALDAILDRSNGEGRLTVSMCLRDDQLETRIGPVDDVLRDELARNAAGELGLRRVLETTVDSIELDGEDVRLTKQVVLGG